MTSLGFSGLVVGLDGNKTIVVMYINFCIAVLACIPTVVESKVLRLVIANHNDLNTGYYFSGPEFLFPFLLSSPLSMCDLE